MKKYLLPLVVAAVLLGIGGATAQQAPVDVSSVTAAGDTLLLVPSLDIPEAMTFAGQTISLDRVDMAERFDRELTSLVYGQTSMLLCIKRANRYFPALERILTEQGVPTDFLYLACTESVMDPLAYSPAKAAGIWQLLAETARQYGLEVTDEVDERYDPEKSAVAACRYLKAAYARYGDWPTAAASYNAGMGRISGELSKQGQQSSFDIFTNQETSRYVFRILAYKLILENPRRYGYRVSGDHLYQPVRYTEETVSTGVADWADWARQHGVSYAQLREANPWIRASKLTNPGRKTYRVRVPVADDLYRSRRQTAAYNPEWVTDSKKCSNSNEMKRIAILVAMEKELALVRHLLNSAVEERLASRPVLRGRVGNVEVVAMQCGIGKVNAAVGATMLINRYAPDALINTGVAGAGDPTVAVGDVVVGERVAYHDVWCGPESEFNAVQGLPHYYQADEQLLAAVPGGDDVHRGLICSGDWFVDTMERAQAIKDVYPDVLAVDMESGSLAQTCHVLGVPFLSMRVISDSPMASHDNTKDYTNFWDDAPRQTFAMLKTLLEGL